MIHRQLRRRGWTLIEMIVVMFCLSLLMSLLATVMWGVFGIQAAATASFEDLQSEARLADRFRADVADARDTPELARDFKADPMCLILRGDDGAFIIYLVEEGRVVRKVMRADDFEVDAFRVGGESVVGEFTRDGRTLTLTLRGPKRGTLNVTACLGGNGP